MKRPAPRRAPSSPRNRAKRNTSPRSTVPSRQSCASRAASRRRPHPMSRTRRPGVDGSMTEDITILCLDDRDRWIAEHQDGGLPSQSWHYAWGLSATGVAPKLAVVRAGGARMLLPFEVRSWCESTDIATILGLSGASITGGSGAPLVLWREFAAAQGWVAGYLQLAVTGDLDAEQLHVAGQAVANNAVFLLDLRKEIALAALSDSIRQKIRR